MELYKKVQSGEDDLGNPITEKELADITEGRFSSWTAEEIALDTRDVTINNRKIITIAPLETLKTADHVKIQGAFHEVKDVKGDDLQRWRLLVVSRYGSDAP